jgi:hypothetical protein
VAHMTHLIFVLQKDSNVKKKVTTTRNLKDCLPSLPLKRRKKKEKESFFSRQCCASQKFKMGQNFRLKSTHRYNLIRENQPASL